MKIVLAPDSFKGNLTSLQVASTLEKGIKRVIPNANCIKVPMADGGEGTVQSLVDATGGKFVAFGVAAINSGIFQSTSNSDGKNSPTR